MFDELKQYFNYSESINHNHFQRNHFNSEFFIPLC